MSEDQASTRKPSVVARIGNLINSSRRRGSSLPSTSAKATEPALNTNEKNLDGVAEKTSPTPTNEQTLASIRSNAYQEELDRRRYVQTLPPWIHSLQEGEDVQEAHPTDSLLPRGPPPSKHPNHHYLPEGKYNNSKGRKYDHVRNREPVIMTSPQMRDATQWRSFVEASRIRPLSSERSEIVNEEWMKNNFPDLEGPWDPYGRGQQPEPSKGFWLFSPERRAATYLDFQRTLMRNAFIPLAIRIIVLTFVLAALALGVYVYRDSLALNSTAKPLVGSTPEQSRASDYICKQQPSTYMAFIVDSIAVVYIIYITYDEYFSRPLGLRRSRDKMRLLFLDLLFIVFSAANLSLAFATLFDEQWACYQGTPYDLNINNDEAARSTCVYNVDLCRRQRALVSVLLIAEIAWVLTFAISTMRVVERISR